MSQPVTRPITEDEVRPFVEVIRTTFMGDQDVSDEQVAWNLERMDLSRSIGAFLDGAICGTARSFPTELTVPGGATVPAGAVTAVTVLPTARRQGHLTRMMDVQLADCVERGETVAVLIAAEWPIYGRFGYGRATEAAQTRVDKTTVHFRDESRVGRIEFVSRDDLRKLAPDVFRAHRLAVHGSIDRDDRWWDYVTELAIRPGDTPSKTRARAVHRDGDGAVDGYAVWEPKEKWEHNRPDCTLEVSELVAASPVAYRELWRFLCDVDLVNTVVAELRPIDEPLQHLIHDGRAVRQAERSDHIWVRILDVPAALEARRYTGDGRVVLEIADDGLGRGGRFALEGGPDGAECSRTDTEPDLVVPVAALGAAYLGGTSFAVLRDTGWVDEQHDGAVKVADAMFATARAPFCNSFF
jgi:predicted acetyltransferase